MSETYHFIGIGGAGMSGLARMLLSRGISVTGSDLRESATTRLLREGGAMVHIGHRAENVGEASQVVYTAAAREENPEVREARRRGLPTIVRAEMLGRVMAERRGIAVAGTHGKTTTTGMVASIFLAAGVDPAVLVGGDWGPIGGTAYPGKGRHVIAESCEAFGSFLHLTPDVAIVTNLDRDHLDCYSGWEEIEAAFRQFLSQIRPGGYAVGCGDDPRVSQLLSAAPRSLTYALEAKADYLADRLEAAGNGTRYRLTGPSGELGTLQVGVPGKHNVLNSMAAAIVALEEGLPWEAVRQGLADFTGVGRRFERLGEVNGALIIDDYAHHPTEIRATLAAAKQSLGRRLTVVFQPHLFSRTRDHLDDFAQSFSDADRLYLEPIYPAREDPIPGIASEVLLERIHALDPERSAALIANREELVDRLLVELGPEDALITMGAGDVRGVGEGLIRHQASGVRR